MFLQKIVVGNLFANCYIVAEGKGGKGIVIDPGD
ncbi:MBL fold metallo-hydrolase, partial [Candidatus Aerophobetes bacterium]